jgi:glycosyltransferase involved in cell wall biosynthesis
MKPSVSIVLEWETVLAAGTPRGVRCLAAMAREMRDYGDGAEMIICFDGNESPAGAAREAGIDCQIVEVPADLDYYGKKNFGFTRTKGDIVVFLDSDLIPEPGWLASLIEPFSDFRKSVVVGRTHLDTATIYDRAVALFWIFDTRESSAAVRPTKRLVSNSVAFRRSVFTHFQFPKRPTFRGPCSELALTLEARNIPMFEQTAARASHPAPSGARQFLSRAFHAGRDQRFYDTLDGNSSFMQCLRQWRVDLKHVRERIAQRRRDIDADWASVAFAFILGCLYYSTKALGYLTVVATAALSGRGAAKGSGTYTGTASGS